MSPGLEIHDGSPYWWLSPDILTVPGNDPDMSKVGTPLAGQPCYVYARVTNNSNTPVQNAQVNYYWANPAVGVTRTTAYPIGASFVSLGARADAWVLCLTPWQVEFANDGHVCLVTEVFEEGSPPPAADFAVPVDPRVAQRNIEVVAAGAAQEFLWVVPVEIHNATQRIQRVVLSTTRGKLADLGELAPQLAHLELPQEDGSVERLAFIDDRPPTQGKLDKGSMEITVDVRPQTRFGIFVAGQAGKGVSLVHVIQRFVDNKSPRFNGVSIVVDARS